MVLGVGEFGINKYEQSFYVEYPNNICRNERNRYEVRLALKENQRLINDNFELWKRRLFNLHQINLLKTVSSFYDSIGLI